MVMYVHVLEETSHPILHGLEYLISSIVIGGYWLKAFP